MPRCTAWRNGESRLTHGAKIIATAAQRIKAKSFTIDGRQCSRAWRLVTIDELRRRVAAHAAIIHAFDLIEHDVAEDGPTIFGRRPCLGSVVMLFDLSGSLRGTASGLPSPLLSTWRWWFLLSASFRRDALFQRIH
jgi:hypothetical protein